MKPFSHRRSANNWAGIATFLIFVMIAMLLSGAMPGADPAPLLFFPTIIVCILLCLATSSIVRALAPQPPPD